MNAFSSANLAQLNIYPIKSSQGISLPTSSVEPQGLAFDRRFVISDLSGQFMTGRSHPQIALIQCKLTMQGLQLTAPNMEELTVNYSDFSRHYENVQVWNSTISAQYCSVLIDAWFSEYLDTPCQLLYFGEQSQRHVKRYEYNNNVKLAFADGYPLLAISQASLDDLNQKLSRENKVSMAQFRPNLVFKNTAAFAEDGWKTIRIGEVEFEIVKPCSRCIFTTVNSQTAQKHPQQQPLNTLKQYRFDEQKKEVMFGQNLIARNQGMIRVGDKIEVLATQPAHVYLNNLTPTNSVSNANAVTSVKSTVTKAEKTAPIKKTPPPKKVLANKIADHGKAQPKNINILFDSWDKYVQGNNKQTLLEQGENAGLILAHSCRAGMCGRCKVKLESGDVQQLATDGLTDEEHQQGYILACSCVPQTDVVISKN